jgi:uncharacterized protein
MTLDPGAQSSVFPNSANAPARKPGMRAKVKRLLALCLGCFCVGLGVIGAVLPLVPSTPFFLCAAGCFASAHPRLEAWLLSFAFIGGPVRAWRERGAIARPAKVTATAGMSFSLIAYAMSGASAWALSAAAGILALCAIFIWTRPS